MCVSSILSNQAVENEQQTKYKVTKGKETIQ